MALGKRIKESMDYMWAPWRMQYILAADSAEGCIFCTKPTEQKDRENGILWRGDTCFAIHNAYPYNPGHLMVVPYRHVSSLTELSHDELRDVMVATKRAITVLDRAMAPDGLNIGINQGRPAGAGITDHIHQHVVPRWAGDTNYMTTIGNTKVLPELVDETYARLAPLFESIPNGG